MRVRIIIVFIIIITGYFTNNILAQVDSTIQNNELNNSSSLLLIKGSNDLLFNTQSYFLIGNLNSLKFKPFSKPSDIKDGNSHNNLFDFSFILNESPFSLQFAIQHGLYGDKSKELNRKSCLWY